MKNITHVLTNPQDLTDERKRQARENIDAAWGAVVPADADETNLLVSTTTMNTVIDEKIANFGGFSVVPLTTQPPYVPDPSRAEPAVQLSNKIIYLTKDASAGKKDPYTEWIYSGDPLVAVDPTKWEIIGETSPDMDSKEDKANKVAEWSATPTDEHYPSEKLVKDELDTKADVSALDDKLDVDADYLVSVENAQDTDKWRIIDSHGNIVDIPGVPTVGQLDDGKVLMAGNNGYSWERIPDATGKADKVDGAVDGNLAGLNEEGNLTDSGIAAEHIALKPMTEVTAGNIASLDAEGNLVDSDHPASELHGHTNKDGLDLIPNTLPDATHDYMLHTVGRTDNPTDTPTVTWMKWDTITVDDPQLYINGTRYNTLTIGNQTWMVENLATESIPGVWYNNSQETAETNHYGKLYDWNSVQQLDVVGWHLPTMAEYLELFAYLQENEMSLFDPQGFNVALSGRWYTHDALGGPVQEYAEAGTYAWLWTATNQAEYADTYAYAVQISSTGTCSNQPQHKAESSLAVRLVKDR